MKRKNLTLVFNHFEQEHLGKDVFLVPYYLGKQLDYDVTIVYRATKTNKNFPHNINGVKLVPLDISDDITIPFYKRNINSLKYIIKYAKQIDLLMCFHHDLLTELRICLYKFFNSKGKAYVKLDLGDLVNRKESRKIFKRWCRNKLKCTFLNKVDILSCETTYIYNQLKESCYAHYQYGDKLVLMPNGFDEDLLNKFQIKENKFEEKENIFVTVGRLGTFQKNTEMILEALAKVDMKNWKFYLIGPIEDSFKKNIDDFYERHPNKKTSVVFIGPIYSKKDLWEYYNKAKVFVFTSRHESYGLVLNEANRFKNYILSTPVGAYYDITDNEKYGSSLKQEDANFLAKKLQQLIDGTLNIDVYKDFIPSEISWEQQIQKLSAKIKKI